MANVELLLLLLLLLLVVVVVLLLLLVPFVEETCDGFSHEACSLSTEAGGLVEVVSGCSDRE